MMPVPDKPNLKTATKRRLSAFPVERVVCSEGNIVKGQKHLVLAVDQLDYALPLGVIEFALADELAVILLAQLKFKRGHLKDFTCETLTDCPPLSLSFLRAAEDVVDIKIQRHWANRTSQSVSYD